jgi:hypothetical protein
VATIIGPSAHGTPTSKSEPSTFPVSVPFSIDAEGKSITIPFDVRPGEVAGVAGQVIYLRRRHEQVGNADA